MADKTKAASHDEITLMKEHLSECEDCRKAYDLMHSILNSPLEIEAEVPPGLSERIRAQVHRKADERTGKKRYDSYHVGFVKYAAAVLFLCFNTALGIAVGDHLQGKAKKHSLVVDYVANATNADEHSNELIFHYMSEKE